MRLASPTPASRLAAASGAAAAAAVLLAGCDMLPLDDAAGEPDVEEATPSPEAAEAEEGRFALPTSCEEVGAMELVGDLAPEGTVVEEQSEEIEEVSGAEQLSCAWYDSASADPGAESFVLVFTVNVDPGDRTQVVRVPGPQEEMNWEVDVDVDVDSYWTPESDELNGELEYVSTVDGSSRQLYLSLPGEFHVSAVAMFSEVTREEMERIVLEAAERAGS